MHTEYWWITDEPGWERQSAGGEKPLSPSATFGGTTQLLHESPRIPFGLPQKPWIGGGTFRRPSPPMNCCLLDGFVGYKSDNKLTTTSLCFLDSCRLLREHSWNPSVDNTWREFSIYQFYVILTFHNLCEYCVSVSHYSYCVYVLPAMYIMWLRNTAGVYCLLCITCLSLLHISYCLPTGYYVLPVMSKLHV